jgi:hypothetical protein
MLSWLLPCLPFGGAGGSFSVPGDDVFQMIINAYFDSYKAPLVTFLLSASSWRALVVELVASLVVALGMALMMT